MSDAWMRTAAVCTVVACVVMASGRGSAQDRAGVSATPDAQIAAMARLEYMVGNWVGTGWIDFGGRRFEFRGSELVQKKLNGTVLLVEGNFLSKPPGAPAEVPVHVTLGVIAYHPPSATYRFATWLGTGSSGERELMLEPQGWRWQIESPKSVVRYVMRLTEAGEWLEIGERSQDGMKWQQFFEMRLRKQ